MDREDDNVVRLLQALHDFGFESLGLQVEGFLDPDQIVQLGYPPHRIDILTDLEGLDFYDCFTDRVTVSLEETEAHFIGLDHLKHHKRILGRHQDLADLENLE